MRKMAYIAFIGLGILAACGKKMPQDSEDMAGQQGDMAVAAVQERRVDVTLSLSANRQLTIKVRDEQKPVRTDLWLYTLEGGALKPFTAFMDPDSSRASRRHMLPCTLAGTPSGLTPCDEGAENGVLSDAARETRLGQKKTAAIDGDVVVPLTSLPTQPLVVVAGEEDQRYSGAAGLTPDGKPATLPVGLGVPGKVARPRSYTVDVAPLLQQRCLGCHGGMGPAAFYRLGSYEDLVQRDFGYDEEVAACADQFPTDAAKRMACEAQITAVEYMIEPGAPALSPLAQRCRPDESKAASAEGLKWFGEGGKRYDDNGDRRMPPENITKDTADDKNGASHFDQNPADYQLLFDWIAQGAQR